MPPVTQCSPRRMEIWFLAHSLPHCTELIDRSIEGRRIPFSLWHLRPGGIYTRRFAGSEGGRRGSGCATRRAVGRRRPLRDEPWQMLAPRAVASSSSRGLFERLLLTCARRAAPSYPRTLILPRCLACLIAIATFHPSLREIRISHSVVNVENIIIRIADSIKNTV